jgi:thymidylate synthase (FAD)
MQTAPQSVELLDFMGSDLTVANVARVSFDKQHAEFEEGDAKLIKYLAKHGHWSPFAHAFAQVRIKAPLFVARQLVKHQVGLSWNEVSRRYVDSDPEFYIPFQIRGRAENVKQGSADTLPLHIQEREIQFIRSVSEDALWNYQQALRAGVAPEQARMVLPLNTMTEWVWSGSVMAFARVCQQRLDAHAQVECREVAEMIYALLFRHFPHSMDALLGD